MNFTIIFCRPTHRSDDVGNSASTVDENPNNLLYGIDQRRGHCRPIDDCQLLWVFAHVLTSKDVIKMLMLYALTSKVYRSLLSKLSFNTKRLFFAGLIV